MTDFWHDPASDTLIYSGVLPAHIAPFLPDAKQAGQFFAVPRTLRNSIVLRRYDYPVAPIMTDSSYDWPIEPGKTPLPHQKVYANFSILNPKCFNLGSPGTMKTLSTLWAADYLMKQFEPGTFRFLIIAPLTILETVWGAGIFRNFMGRRTFKILIGDEAKRMKLLAEPADFYIVNPDGIKIGAHLRGPKRMQLGGFSAALEARKDIMGVIVDEASAYKDASTARHAITQKVLRDRPVWWGLTGTPTPNRPTDAYGLAKFVNNALGKSFRGFQIETMIKISLYKWVPQKDGYEKARRLLTPSVRYALEDVWDGPEMTIQRHKVELTDEQKKEMVRLKNDLTVIAKSGVAISANNEAAARQKLMQISLGAIYDENHKAHIINALPRYNEIAEIIESAERKVLVFVGITSVIHLLVDFMQKRWKKEGRDWTCDFINGEVSARKRPDLIRSFESDPNFKVMFADPQATAHGINEFVAADTVIWAGTTDKAELFIQGNGRVRRPGQKHPTTCYQIVSNKLEEEIFDRLETNTGLQGVMLKAIREGKF